MSFYVGNYQVINMSGEANRIAFVEDKQMDLGEGFVNIRFHLIGMRTYIDPGIFF